MQKKVVISIIVVNIFVLAVIAMVMSYGNKIDSQYSVLNDDQIRIYNPRGFTIEEMKAVKLLDDTSEVIFDNRNIFPTYYLEFDYGSRLTAKGISIEEDNLYQQKIDYLAGSYLTAKYQVIISQSIADILITNGYAKDYDGLIGTDFVEGLEIVGVYPNFDSTEKRVFQKQIIPSDTESGYREVVEERVENGFMLFNRGSENKMADEIMQYNINVAFDYEDETRDYERYIYNYNDSIESNDEAIYQVNYKESVANGAEGLIDPQTKVYGKKFNDYAFINTKQNRDQVVAKLAELFPEAVIITNDSKLFDAINQTRAILWFVMWLLIFEGFIFVPMNKNGKK